MPRDKDLASVLDIIHAIKQIQRYVEGLDLFDLKNNDEKQGAVLYRITIIGEATKRLSQEFRDRYPEISWKEMAGMRDVVIHQYDGVDLEIVWSVIQERIPVLLEMLEPLIKPN
jgi:uncharacterized protein with HEPN domain